MLKRCVAAQLVKGLTTVTGCSADARVFDTMLAAHAVVMQHYLVDCCSPWLSYVDLAGTLTSYVASNWLDLQRCCVRSCRGAWRFLRCDGRAGETTMSFAFAARGAGYCAAAGCADMELTFVAWH
eukprot:3251863-Pyramimonas_sp.AAC.1